MKIVCYINKLAGGGAERVMSVLASGLAQRGHCVTIVVGNSVSDEYPLDEQVERVTLDQGSVPTSKKGAVIRTWRRLRKLRRICRERDADILVSFIRDANLRGILATRLSKTKSLISVRIDPKIGYRKRSAKLLAKFVYPMAEGCVFQTEDAQAWFAPKIQKKSRVIFNPISDAFYSVEPAAMQEKRIVTCGRLDSQKRFDLLIDAFDKVCDDFPEYKLEIYGVGGEQNALQAQIDKLGRPDRIFLMGRSQDVPNAIKTASLFVLSSDYEGLPNALMEAMVLHLPVISTDCGGGGARALIEDGIDGIIVPCGDAEALANAIRESLSDSEAAKQRGEMAGMKAKHFSVESIVAQWEAYITDIVNN